MGLPELAASGFVEEIIKQKMDKEYFYGKRLCAKLCTQPLTLSLVHSRAHKNLFVSMGSHIPQFGESLF